MTCRLTGKCCTSLQAMKKLPLPRVRNGRPLLKYVECVRILSNGTCHFVSDLVKYDTGVCGTQCAYVFKNWHFTYRKYHKIEMTHIIRCYNGAKVFKVSFNICSLCRKFHFIVFTGGQFNWYCDRTIVKKTYDFTYCSIHSGLRKIIATMKRNSHDRRARLYDQFNDWVQQKMRDSRHNPNITLTEFDNQSTAELHNHVEFTLENVDNPRKELFSAAEKFRPGTVMEGRENIKGGGNRYYVTIPLRSQSRNDNDDNEDGELKA